MQAAEKSQKLEENREKDHCRTDSPDEGSQSRENRERIWQRRTFCPFVGGIAFIPKLSVLYLSETGVYIHDQGK